VMSIESAEAGNSTYLNLRHPRLLHAAGSLNTTRHAVKVTG
jgi:hypothetical protein